MTPRTTAVRAVFVGRHPPTPTHHHIFASGTEGVSRALLRESRHGMDRHIALCYRRVIKSARVAVTVNIARRR